MYIRLGNTTFCQYFCDEGGIDIRCGGGKGFH